MAFCTVCGNSLDPSARSCVKCGASVKPAGERARTVHRFSFHGRTSGLLLLYLKFYALSAVTFGIYSFWGRTEVRRYFAENIRFDDVPFAYHGTPWELLIGRLKVTVVVIALLAQLNIFVAALGLRRGLTVGLTLISLSVLFALPIAVVGAWRYRLSRTSLRGVRFSFRGDIWAYVRLFATGLLLSALTLGIYTPMFVNSLRKFCYQNTYFGNAPFEYDGDGREMILPWVICLVLAPFSFGFSLAHFKVRQFNYQWNHTKLQGARFVSKANIVEYVFLIVTNFVLRVITLGLAVPLLLPRVLHFQFENVYLQGEIHMEQIMQEFRDSSPIGEGISSFLDPGTNDLGLGV